MSGLANLSPLSEAAEKIEGLAGLPNITGIYPGAQQPSEKTSTDKRGIMEEGYDSFLHTLGPQNISLFGAGIRALGAVVQQEDAYGAGYKIEQYGENLDMGETPSTSLREVEDLESLARWAAGGLGQGLGSIGPPIVAGGVGFAAGTAIGGPGVGALAGAASAFAVNDVILTGEAFKQFEESGVDRLTAAEAAAAIGPPMAVLDTLGLMKMLRGPARARKGLFKYIAQRMLQGASVESATEMAQGVIREFTDASLTGDPKLAERAFNIVEEGLVAAMTGGVIGGGAGSLSRKTPEAEPEPTPAESVIEEETPAPQDTTLKEETLEDPLEVQLVDDLATAETELEGVKESLEEVTPEPKETEKDLKTVDVAPEESYTEFKDTEPEQKKPNTKKIAGLEAVAPEKPVADEKPSTAKPKISDKIIVHAPTQEIADTIAGGIDLKMATETKPKKTGLEAVAPTSTPKEIEIEALKTEPAPTEKQKEAGNYKKGHIKVAGFDVTIENAKGSKRSGTSKDGEKWEVKMPAHYGYIRKTEGADGEQVDIYVGGNLKSNMVFVVDQQDADTKEFDEHKVMLGYGDQASAQKAYEAGFSDNRGAERIQEITAIPIRNFKEWLNKEDTTKPVAEAALGEAVTSELEPKAEPDTKPEAITFADKDGTEHSLTIDSSGVVSMKDSPEPIGFIRDIKGERSVEFYDSDTESFNEDFKGRLNEAIRSEPENETETDKVATEEKPKKIKEVSETESKTKPEAEPEPETESKHQREGFGAKNKVFTQEKHKENVDVIKDFFKTQSSQLNAGLPLDPKMLAAVVEVSGFHVEAGARAFTEYATAMVDTLGDGIKPYLKYLYGMVRDFPGFDNTEMSTLAEIDEYIERTNQAEKEQSDETEGRETKGDRLRGVLDDRELDERDSPRDDEGTKPGTAGGITDESRTEDVRTRASGRGDETTGVLPDSESRRDQGASTVNPAGLSREETGTGPDAVGNVRELPRSVGNVKYFGRGADTGIDPLSFKGDNLKYYGTETDKNPDPLSEERSPLQKARGNVTAIQIVKKIRNEKRRATATEQKKLSLYVGWGPAKGAFPNLQGNYASGFETVGKELKKLLTEKEYFTAQQSIQNAHYTSTTVIYAMWELALKLGVRKGSSILEPGMGIGHFAGFMPEQIRVGTKYHGIEMDAVTADIAKELFPDFQHRAKRLRKNKDRGKQLRLRYR